jgi:four helix bundle protein
MSDDGPSKRQADYAASFRDLRVYQASLELSLAIFEASKSFPKEERFSLTDQIRRSSRAVAANLTEAWAKRRYPAAFIAKLSDSMGEAFETQSWLDQARQAGYLDESTHQSLDSKCAHIGSMLRAMENKADSFCGPRS